MCNAIMTLFASVSEESQADSHLWLVVGAHMKNIHFNPQLSNLQLDMLHMAMYP